MKNSQKIQTKHKKINNIKDIINIKTTIICFCSTAIALMGFYGVVVGFIGDNAFSLWLKTWHIAYKVITIIVMSLLTTLIKIVWSFCKKTSAVFDDNESLQKEMEDLKTNLNEKEAFIRDHSDSLCYILEEATQRKRYKEVVSIGTNLSLPLWYTGKYLLRIKIGHMIEFASAQLGDKATQALVLIEDIGWTNIRINNHKEGMENIMRGLGIANEINDAYLIAQAKRNLADINLIQSKELQSINDKTTAMNACKTFIDEAYSVATSMKKSNKQKELLGNIWYTYSKYYLELGDDKEALVSLNESLKIYKEIGFTEKQIKLYALKGKILIKEKSESLAIDAFQEGLRLAQLSNVNVHIATNSLALCKIYINKSNYELARQMLIIAENIIAAINDPITIGEYETCKALLDNKENKQ